jgi:hypothetical protein
MKVAAARELMSAKSFSGRPPEAVPSSRRLGYRLAAYADENRDYQTDREEWRLSSEITSSFNYRAVRTICLDLGQSKFSGGALIQVNRGAVLSCDCQANATT